MAPIVRLSGDVTRPLPDFAVDPHAWFDRVGADLLAKGWPAVLAAMKPCMWTSPSGHRWRLVRTDRSIEIRPELGNPFLRVGESLRVSAIAIGETIGVELTTRQGQWVDYFRRDSFDIAALGHAMLNEQELPHDNLAMVFPPPTTPPPKSGR